MTMLSNRFCAFVHAPYPGTAVSKTVRARKEIRKTPAKRFLVFLKLHENSPPRQGILRRTSSEKRRQRHLHEQDNSRAGDLREKDP